MNGLLVRWTRWSARLAAELALVLGITSLLAFGLIALAPGDAATRLAQQRAGHPGVTEDQVASARRELGMEGSVPERYVRWLGHAVQGDLGKSARTGRPVLTELTERVPVTLSLAGLTAVVALPLGLLVGALAAMLPWRPARRGLRLTGLLAVSLPTFWVSYLLVVVLAEQLGLLPTSADGGPAGYVMPVVVLALPAVGLLSRVVAVSLREALAQPYVRAAQARGAPTVSIVVRDALPNVAGAVLNTIGLIVGGMLTGALVVETVFAHNGIGDYFVQAVNFRDLMAIQACVLCFALAFTATNRLADRLHGRIDPRVSGG
ncbi:ABC transporter permease [Micromonospora sp.]|uniref:ABC transporter permease n=1 Tax=Micromonospora sp. TaxID=1876 RepID=UPI003B3A09A3